MPVMPDLFRHRPMMATHPGDPRLSRFTEAVVSRCRAAVARLRAGAQVAAFGKRSTRIARFLALPLHFAAAIRRPGATETRHRPFLPDVSDHLLRDIGLAPDQVRRRAGH